MRSGIWEKVVSKEEWVSWLRISGGPRGMGPAALPR